MVGSPTETSGEDFIDTKNLPLVGGFLFERILPLDAGKKCLAALLGSLFLFGLFLFCHGNPRFLAIGFASFDRTL